MTTTLKSSLIVLLLAVAVSASPAADFYWGTPTAVSSWQDEANWYEDVSGTIGAATPPGSADDAVFSITSVNATAVLPVLSANTTINSITFANEVALTMTGTSGNRNLEVGAGGLTLSVSATNVTLGTSSSGKNVFVKVLESQTWTNNSGGTLNIRNSSQASDSAAGPVVLTLNAAGAGNISNSGAFSDGATQSLGLIVDSAGTGVVGMANSGYSGGTTVKRGVLQSSGNFGSQGVLLGDVSGDADARLHLTGISTNNITVQASGTGLAALTGSGSADYQGNILLNRDVSLGSVASTGQTIIFSGVISGTGNITAGRVATGSSNPTVILSGSNTFIGKTTIDSATVVVNSLNRVVGGTASSSLGAAPLDAAMGTIRMSAVTASTLRYVGTGEATDRVIEMASNSGATLEQAGTGHLEFEGGVSMAGTGSRTLTLRGATAGTGEISGVINNIGGGFNTSVTKTDSGTWTLSGTANLYSGGTSITGGVLEVTKIADGGVASSMGLSSNSSGNLSFGGGTLRYIGSGDSSNRIFNVGAAGATFDASGSGALTFTNATAPSHSTTATPRSITLTGTNTGANTMSANLGNASGTGLTSIVKEGAGTWVLAGASTYTGATTINAGTLLIDGSLNAGSAVAVNAGTLGGSGTVNGLVTTAGTSSVLSPGNSPGTLNLLGGLDASSGAAFVFELGTASDLLNLGSGTFTGSSMAGGLVFNFSDSGGLLTGNPYTLMTFGSASGLDYSDLAANLLPSGYALDSSFGTGGFLINGTDLQVQFGVIPEPSTVTLLMGGLIAAIALRRRRGL